MEALSINTRFCESPIEEKLLKGLDFMGRRSLGFAPYFEWHFYTEADRALEGFLAFAKSAHSSAGRDSFFVAQNLQTIIGEKLYRPDFFLYMIQRDRAYQTGFHTGGVFVECDGKEFHSSAEQIERDRIREEALLLTGFRTIRFTGAEICRRPARCAKTAIWQLPWRAHWQPLEQMATI